MKKLRTVTVHVFKPGRNTPNPKILRVDRWTEPPLPDSSLEIADLVGAESKADGVVDGKDELLIPFAPFKYIKRMSQSYHPEYCSCVGRYGTRYLSWISDQ